MEDKQKIEKEVTELASQRDSIKSEIELFKTELFAIVEGKPTIQEQITSRVSAMETGLKKLSDNIDNITNFHNEILSPKDGAEKSKADQVNEAYTKITKDKIKVEEDLKTIDSFKFNLFGDEESKQTGQKQRFDTYEEEIKQKKKTWDENADSLFKKIEGLLPGATSTGLAKAYQDQRKSYDWPYWLWAGVFVLTMIGIIYFAIEHIKVANSFSDAIMIIISRLPIFIPAFWLAIFASKQQSQNKRLQQEYAFKEVLTKSYEADKREIEKLPESTEKNKLSAKLLEIMIDAAKYNPSDTLNNKAHNESPPSILDLFKMKMVKKISGENTVEKK
jgi:hypothetical protein